MATNSPSINGWNPWVLEGAWNGVIKFPDTACPYLYFPSRSVWYRSLIDATFTLPFISPITDPYSTFMMTGGGTGTLLGALAGLASLRDSFSGTTRYVLSTTLDTNEMRGMPQTGYCMGRNVKQHAYFHFEYGIVGSLIFPTAESVAVMQNSKFRRIYVYQGMILSVNKTADGEYDVALDFVSEIGGRAVPESDSFAEKMTIVGNGKSGSVAIVGINPNWTLRVKASDSTDYLVSGGFYTLSYPVCIDDPFMLSGDWLGTENDMYFKNGGANGSGFDVHLSSHNTFYEEGVFTGAYVLKSGDDISPVPEGSSMVTSSGGGTQWCFFGFGNSVTKSEVYPDEKRYIEVLTPVNKNSTVSASNTASSAEGQTTSTTTLPANVDISYYMDRGEMDAATAEDVDAWANLTGYVRLEINIGGNTKRHNWHASCLTNQYIKVAGSYYRILSQVTANIIDVAIVGVDGKSALKLDGLEFSIFNHFGWFISEHYDELNNARAGIFGGKISGSSGKLKMEVALGDNIYPLTPFSIWKPEDLTSNCLIERYKKAHKHSDAEPIKFYNKFSGWRLVSFDGKQNTAIKNIIFPEQKNAYEAYDISIETVDKAFSMSGEAYISFDQPYETIPSGSWSKYTYFSAQNLVTISQSYGMFAQYGVNKMGEMYFTPLKLNLPKESRVGFTGYNMFGYKLEFNPIIGTVPYYLISTLGGSGFSLSSFFNNISYEDWIVYRDLASSNMTIRRGSDNFRDLPKRQEVFIGSPTFAQSGGGNDFTMYKRPGEDLRLGKVRLKLENSGEPVTFSVASSEYTYGFVSSGVGKREYAIKDPTFLNETLFVDKDGNRISPVFIQGKDEYQQQSSMSVDLAADVNDGRIIVNGPGSVDHQYYYEIKQVLNSESVSLCDIYKTYSGSELIVYSDKVGEFTANGVSVTSSDCVMAIGSFDDGNNWLTPSHDFKTIEGKEDVQNQYPIMLMNNFMYLASIYDYNRNDIVIFAKSTDTGTPYVGVFRINMQLLDSGMVIAEPKNTDKLNFFYRPPALSDSALKNFGAAPAKMDAITDDFFKAIGYSGSGAQVTYDNELGIVSVSKTATGIYFILFDSPDGVRTIVSEDNGSTWRASGVIIARASVGGLIIGGYFFYIQNSQIYMKLTYQGDWDILAQAAINNKNAGKEVSSSEIDIQNSLDSRETVLVWGSPVKSQRLTGYSNPEGIFRLFFYSDTGILIGVESSDMRNWSACYNF